MVKFMYIKRYKYIYIYIYIEIDNIWPRRATRCDNKRTLGNTFYVNPCSK